MSDFDRVLERLLVDPAFKAALAADPDKALAGYQLAAEERDLLGVPVSTSAGVSHVVEDRMTKSGVAGLVGPVVTAFGVAGAQSLGSAQYGASTFGAVGGQSVGDAPGAGESSFGNAPRSDGGTVTFEQGDEPTETFGSVRAAQGWGEAPGTEAELVEATDYRTRVDVNGDGRWDAHTAYERADGGVDIHVDIDRDGRVDFIGQDVDRDGLVDVAEYDKDLDGAMDTRMYDDTGDGWLDRRESIPESEPGPASPQTFGHAPQ
jgi:hypothetical protein